MEQNETKRVKGKEKKITKKTDTGNERRKGNKEIGQRERGYRKVRRGGCRFVAPE